LLDSRPLSEQTFADIEVFLQQGVAENLTLDYKRELGDSISERAEMCKDVSALAGRHPKYGRPRTRVWLLDGAAHFDALAF